MTPLPHYNLLMCLTLLISWNLLKDLPEVAFPSLKRLKTLNLSKNPKLKKLPKTIGHCHAIQNLVGPDPDVVQYPPQNIVNQGTEQIMKFLAKGKTCSSIRYCISSIHSADYQSHKWIFFHANRIIRTKWQLGMLLSSIHPGTNSFCTIISVVTVNTNGIKVTKWHLGTL